MFESRWPVPSSIDWWIFSTTIGTRVASVYILNWFFCWKVLIEQWRYPWLNSRILHIYVDKHMVHFRSCSFQILIWRVLLSLKYCFRITFWNFTVVFLVKSSHVTVIVMAVQRETTSFHSTFWETFVQSLVLKLFFYKSLKHVEGFSANQGTSFQNWGPQTLAIVVFKKLFHKADKYSFLQTINTFFNKNNFMITNRWVGKNITVKNMFFLNNLKEGMQAASCIFLSLVI